MIEPVWNAGGCFFRSSKKQTTPRTWGGQSDSQGLMDSNFGHNLHSLKLTFSPLQMDGWNTILSYWGSLFSGATLVSGRVSSPVASQPFAWLPLKAVMFFCYDFHRLPFWDGKRNFSGHFFCLKLPVGYPNRSLTASLPLKNWWLFQDFLLSYWVSVTFQVPELLNFKWVTPLLYWFPLLPLLPCQGHQPYLDVPGS